MSHDEPLHDDVPPDLAAAFPDVGAAPTPVTSEAMRDGLSRLHDALDDEGLLARISALETTARWAMAGLLLLLLCVVVVVTTPRADLWVLPPARMALELGLLLGALGLTLRGALRPVNVPCRGAWGRVVPLAAGVVSVGLLVGLSMAHTGAMPAGLGAELVPGALACFSFGLIFAALAGIGLSALSRARGPRWIPGALSVWAAALMGLAALYLHCPSTHPVHLWAGHATILVPALIVVWFVRRRLDG